jgi:hypothetical protein
MKNWFESKYSAVQLRDIYRDYYKGEFGEYPSDDKGNRCRLSALLEDLDQKIQNSRRHQYS